MPNNVCVLCLHPCVWRPEANVQVCSSITLNFMFGDKTSHWFWSLLTSKSQESPILLSPLPDPQLSGYRWASPCLAGPGRWASKFKGSCLCSKPLTGWDISSAAEGNFYLEILSMPNSASKKKIIQKLERWKYKLERRAWELEPVICNH